MTWLVDFPEYQRKYRKSKAGKKRLRKYARSRANKEAQRRYRDANRELLRAKERKRRLDAKKRAG